MNKSIYKNIIAFTLFALMFFKVSALHVYSHQDSSFDAIENCKVCESAIENQNAEYTFQSTATFEYPNNTIFSTDSFEITSQEIPNNTLHFRLFGRPPPTLI